LEHRHANFLALVRRGVYEQAASPYRHLLRLAGCEYGDLEQLVRQDDVEGALRTLYRSGVYLTVDEHKGRTPLVRGSVTLHVEPSLFANPRAAQHLPAQSSGSRGSATVVGIDLESIRDTSMNRYLALQPRGAMKWQHGIWVVPGGTTIATLLSYSFLGVPPVRWFSLVDSAAPGVGRRYQWSTRAVRWGSLLGGVRLPRPQFVPLESPLPIAHWMAEVLAAGSTPHLFTSTSCGVRLCQAAAAAGVDLGGAQLTVGGEPITPTRAAEMRQAGVTPIPRYASVECGRIGYACLAPEEPDEVHVAHDLFAVIQPGAEHDSSGPMANDLLITSLALNSRLILLNLSLGDQAVLTRRRCGCALEELGWPVHLHTIRSHEKLTAGGMTFLDSDVIRVLEDVLPRQFGGGPTHYQLIEEETPEGKPQMRLLVHPSLGPLDEDAVAETFLAAVGHGSGGERIMGEVWRQGNYLRVERAAPRATGSGKILHLRAAVESESGTNDRTPLGDA